MKEKEENPFESQEEWYFSWWLNDLKEKGIIKKYTYEPNKFILSKAKSYPIKRLLKTKDRVDQLSLLQEHIYTPDFLVEWNKEWQNKFYRLIQDEECTNKPDFFAITSRQNEEHYTFFEIKPQFDQNNMTRLFIITQKWLYDKYGIYVEKFEVPTMFKRTFTPGRYLLTDKSRLKRKIKFDIKLIDKYLEKL
jgi:hypothetical protein